MVTRRSPSALRKRTLRALERSSDRGSGDATGVGGPRIKRPVVATLVTRRPPHRRAAAGGPWTATLQLRLREVDGPRAARLPLSRLDGLDRQPLRPVLGRSL